MMIRMLLEGMLDDLGHTVAGEAGAIDEALALAKDAEFDIALLDVNLNGRPITPVVEILIKRGLPFVFASGYGQGGVPEPYRGSPTLQKPFQVEALAKRSRRRRQGLSRWRSGRNQPEPTFRSLFSNNAASRVMVGSSVMSIFSGVTAIVRSSMAAISVPCSGSIFICSE